MRFKKRWKFFRKKGYSGASMRDLTEAMQISVTSIYNTIGDKHQLFVRCISDYINNRMQEAVAALV
ncbi:TetR/AcrR family transcriptional regulator [Pedobacter sp. R-06]|uniref:TetR/AcrR family transcriptional regulator n=1 Tax=Pedobacter sp. R-06 TaxID=3404051 RepID=UPI003CF2ADC1